MNAKPTRNYCKVEGKITREELFLWLNEGKTNRQIAEMAGCSRTNIGPLINKWGLREQQKYHKRDRFSVNKIDTPEKAYLLGFVVCNAAIDMKKMVEISVALRDREVVDALAQLVDANVNVSNACDPKARRFPRARISKKIPDILTFVGAAAKEHRHYPIVSEKLERYLLLGAFDADGCITWGRRKDKNRIWQKICFNSCIGVCLGVQQVLRKHLQIASVVRPKSDKENCYTLEFSAKEDVLKFLDFIYQDDFIVLHRKYSKACALRLELEENGGTAKRMAQYRAEPAEQEGVETSGAVAKQLNDRSSIQGHLKECLRDSPNGGTNDLAVLRAS